MTYRELQLLLGSANVTKEQLNQDVTVLVRQDNEFFKVEKLKAVEDTDVLDKGHLYMETV